MNELRKNDTRLYTKYRPSRFFKDGGKWHFHTRELTVEGPFEHRWEAEEKLEVYVKIVNSGFYGVARELTLEPIRPR
jgi:hypothetical protein